MSLRKDWLAKRRVINLRKRHAQRKPTRIEREMTMPAMRAWAKKLLPMPACELCNVRGLEIMHYRWICTRRDGGQETIGNVVVFCHACHKLTHGMHWANRGVMVIWVKRHKDAVQALYAYQASQRKRTLQQVMLGLREDQP